MPILHSFDKKGSGFMNDKCNYKISNGGGIFEDNNNLIESSIKTIDSIAKTSSKIADAVNESKKLRELQNIKKLKEENQNGGTIDEVKMREKVSKHLGKGFKTF